MLINPKSDMLFTGAKSGKKIKMIRHVLLEVDPDDLKGVDKRDYEPAKSGKPGQKVEEEGEPKKK